MSNTWIEPVTDRTQTDVDEVLTMISKGFANLTTEEQTEWLNGMKGAINASDLNRVQNNIQIISDLLGLGLSVDTIPDLPKASLYTQMVNNVASIRSDSPLLHKSTPKTPKIPLTTYSKWNDLETILKDVYIILTTHDYNYCGEGMYAGSDLLL